MLKTITYITTITWLFCLQISIAHAKVSNPDEGSVRAAMIFAILKYSRLSIDLSDAKLALCVVGSPTSENKLKMASGGVKVYGKEVLVLEKKSFAESVTDCHTIIYGEKTPPIDKNIQFNKQLVICDGCKEQKEFAAVELINVNKKIRFNINLIVSAENKVRFSSALLELASEIKDLKK